LRFCFVNPLTTVEQVAEILDSMLESDDRMAG
jgi:hypothetical protein